MPDPRISIIDERLRDIRDIIAVSSGKGGVGKSLVASMLALSLANRGCSVGLLDLDFTSPSTHLILGVKGLRPAEDRGIVPPQVHGLRYMSIVYYSGEQASPLRGSDSSNVLIELLSVTIWGKLDFLIIDMPPGIGDVTLDVVRLIKNIKFLIVTTPSILAFETVRKLASLLKELEIPTIGIIENMKTNRLKSIRQEAENEGITFLGEIPFDTNIEDCIGRVDKLKETVFAEKVDQIASKIGTSNARSKQNSR